MLKAQKGDRCSWWNIKRVFYNMVFIPITGKWLCIKLYILIFCSCMNITDWNIFFSYTYLFLSRSRFVELSLIIYNWLFLAGRRTPYVLHVHTVWRTKPSKKRFVNKVYINCNPQKGKKHFTNVVKKEKRKKVVSSKTLKLLVQ